MAIILCFYKALSNEISINPFTPLYQLNHASTTNESDFENMFFFLNENKIWRIVHFLFGLVLLSP